MLTRREFLVMAGGLLAGCTALIREPDYTVVMLRQPTFDPGALTVPRGAMVAWHNKGDRVHTVTFDPAQSATPERVVLPDGVAPFGSGDLFAGDRWAYTFDVAGTYVYFCRYDEHNGMIGSVNVTG